MRHFGSHGLLRSSAFAALLCLMASPAWAGGIVGDHVKDLSAHLGEYEKEVNWLIGQVDDIIDGYEKGGTEKAEPERLVEIWEEVDFHAAIEVNYAPIYASIWQGLFGVKLAIEEGASKDAVRAEEAKLEHAFWQALGAVKMAAYHQQRQPARAEAAAGKAETPTATLLEVERRLGRVLAKYAEQLPDEATAIVYDTYQTRFEGVEGALIERDAELVESLEIDFNVTLPKAMKDGASVDAVREIVNAMQTKLARARELLAAAEKNRKPVF